MDSKLFDLVTNPSAYHNTFEVSQLTECVGWGIYHCLADGVFPVFCVCSHRWFECPASYGFNEFVDMAAELPLWCFVSLGQSLEFAKHHSNMYPIERQIFYLRCHADYWLSSILSQYYSYADYLKSVSDATKVKNGCYGIF